ncbi:MAG TPA: hypothetical protein VG842_01125 [Sediminibacterium sp.]|nr:hypothetical protein [Sediminibacterium sp.]
MKQITCLPVLLLLYCPLQKAQRDSSLPKQNPILFLESFFGAAGGDQISGLALGGSLHYQHRLDLFSVRFSGILDLQPPPDFNRTGVLIRLPGMYKSLGEVSLLYGKRWIRPGHSLSISAGLSENFFGRRLDSTAQYNWLQSNNTGIAWEANIKWFKKKKRPFHVYYGLIPLGRPTGFGRSYGLKLSGNISKTWYVGLAGTIGFGWHKKY